MAVTISSQRLGPVGRYSSKHPLPRTYFTPGGKMNLWRWSPATSDALISVNALSALSLLALHALHFNNDWFLFQEAFARSLTSKITYSLHSLILVNETSRVWVLLLRYSLLSSTDAFNLLSIFVFLKAVSKFCLQFFLLFKKKY